MDINSTEEAKKEIDILIRSKYSLLYIISSEKENDILLDILDISQSSNLKKDVFVWDGVLGLNSVTKSEDQIIFRNEEQEVDEAIEILTFINSKESKDNSIYILMEFHQFLTNPKILRLLRIFSQNTTESSRKTIIMLSPPNNGFEGKIIPKEIENITYVFNWPYPDTNCIREYFLNRIIPKVNSLLEKSGYPKIDLNEEKINDIVESCKGLTLFQIENAITRSIVSTKTLSKDRIIQEKKQIINKQGLCDYIEPSETIEDVGGLRNLKEWLKERKDTISKEAYNFGCDYPRGVMLLGPWGTGKSLLAKTIINEWNIPGLKVDASSLYHMFVGSSESRTKDILRLAESISPCVLWFEEAENLLATSSSSSDGGTSSRVLGMISTWMSEHEGLIFSIYTANEIPKNCPKLFRKGRIDGFFVVDLPVIQERDEIYKIHVNKIAERQMKNGIIENTEWVKQINYFELASASKNFSGAEIRESVVDAARYCFNKRKMRIDTEDILKCIKNIIPMSITMKEQIEEMREWQKTRAISASAFDPEDISV